MTCESCKGSGIGVTIRAVRGVGKERMIREPYLCSCAAGDAASIKYEQNLKEGRAGMYGLYPQQTPGRDVSEPKEEPFGLERSGLNTYPKLEPCPFCGTVPTYHEFSKRDWFNGLLLGVLCSSCGASTKWERTEVEAAKHWNMRALA